MIEVISRFRVKNDKVQTVREAFRDRPRLVDRMPGFLGMEVFTDTQDPSVFCLVTRWTDVAHYHAWHGSEAHRISQQSIPRGLKLDGDYTEVTILERLAAPGWEAVASDALPLVGPFLAQAHSAYFLKVGSDGIIQFCNDGLAELVQRPAAEIVGQPLWSLLAEDDIEAIRRRLGERRRQYEEPFLLNFVDTRHFPVTLLCRLDVQPEFFMLLGEAPRKNPSHEQEELLQLNNQLAVLSRENAQKNKELEKAKAEITQALAELRDSHWLLRKLQEVLPICMECGKVKAGDAWENVVDYLKHNALFLSHGYCPACAAHLMEKWNLTVK